MSEPVIRIQNLSKRYRIGVKEERYRTIRESIMSGIKAPFKNIKTLRKLTNFDNSSDNSDEKDVIWALKNVSFEVKEGEVVGLIGRNGAGKSTLLKILSRITEPTEGEVRIHGRVKSLLEVGTGFHPELTGRENIFLNGAILGMRKEEIKMKFDEIIAFAEIETFMDTPVKRYSSGMYMRLAFAVAAHLESEILLVDEVLAVGDMAFQKKCLSKMSDVAKGGRTVFFVSHNMSAIRTLCGSAVWLNNGQIVNIGPADEIVRDCEWSQTIHIGDSSCVVERNPEDVKKLSFYISRVEVLNTEGEHTNIFNYNDKLILIVEVSGEPLESNYGVEFRIYKDSGEFACTGTSGPMHGIYFGRKNRRIKIRIGPILLTFGRYTISLSTMTEGRIRTDRWDNVCCFHIVECHPFALPQEIKTPVCVIQHSFCAVE